MYWMSGGAAIFGHPVINSALWGFPLFNVLKPCNLRGLVYAEINRPFCSKTVMNGGVSEAGKSSSSTGYRETCTI